MTVLAVIPARGGSKGIPRKCVRPLAGKPLIFYAITACLRSPLVDRVVVSTDDDEIAMLAERFGAGVIKRPEELADDQVTIDPVIQHAVPAAEAKYREHYQYIYTIQPTSPLISPQDIEEAHRLFLADPQLETVLSVVDDRHLTWAETEDGHPVPNYSERVNRQQLPKIFKETGAIIACTRLQLTSGSRIGRNIGLLEMPYLRSFDIDTYADFYLCESLLKRKRIVFVVTGYPEVGLGHAYRTLMLANELISYDLYFVCEERSTLAAAYIKSLNYNVTLCPNDELLETISDISPHLIINDILDTSIEYMEKLRSLPCKIVNFEDLGPGNEYADLVVNALYPGSTRTPRVLEGHEYFCLRDEFLYLPHKPWRNSVDKILITFGGVDEGNLTARVLDILAPLCQARAISIDVIVGPGYAHRAEADLVRSKHMATNIEIIGSTARISDYMAKADLAITSGGRTVFELAAVKVPTIVICQNQRESTHTFASWDNGILNIGVRDKLTDEYIRSELLHVLNDSKIISTMRAKLGKLSLAEGKSRVIKSLTALLD